MRGRRSDDQTQKGDLTIQKCMPHKMAHAGKARICHLKSSPGISSTPSPYGISRVCSPFPSPNPLAHSYAVLPHCPQPCNPCLLHMYMLLHRWATHRISRHSFEFQSWQVHFSTRKHGMNAGMLSFEEPDIFQPSPNYHAPGHAQPLQLRSAV